MSPTEEATDNTGFAFPHIFFYASLLVFVYLLSFYSGVWGRVRRAIAADAAVVSNSGRSSHFALVLCGDFFSFFFSSLPCRIYSAIASGIFVVAF